jgi:hypothetical protein
MTAAVKVDEVFEPDWARVMRVVEFQRPDKPLSPDEIGCAVWLMLDAGMDLVRIRERVPGLTRQACTDLKNLRTRAVLGDKDALAAAPTFEMRFFLGISGICRPGSDLAFREVFGDVC